MLVFTVKYITIFFGLATTAFCVSTIVLAVQKTNLKEELQDALHKLDIVSTTTTPASVPPSSTTALTPLTTTEQPSTTTLSSTTTVNSSSTESSGTAISATSSKPRFPTLPTGLPDPQKVIYRLPSEVRPIKYKVYINPNLLRKTCNGLVSIQIEVVKETNLIVLHAKNLEIQAMSVLNMMARMRIRIKRSYLDADREMYFIEFDEILSTMASYQVSLSYECQLDGLQGFYLSSYLDADKKDSRIMSTSSYTNETAIPFCYMKTM